MATTTNYGWTTPDDTDLVKDGASAIRTLGSSIDTTTKNLNPSTTLGDIEYRSSTANTNTRLGIGTTGQVLTVAGGVPSWATPSSGSMTLLSTTTITSGTTVTVSSISQSYKNLYLEFIGITKSTNAAALFFYPDSSSAISKVMSMRSTNANIVSVRSDYITTITGLKPSNSENAFYMTIYNYASTTDRKGYNLVGHYVDNGDFKVGFSSQGGLDTASAIDSMQITWDNAEAFTGGTIRVYGVN